MSILNIERTNKKAFTLVEAMLLLVVVSLIMASSVAVITRKHKMKPHRSVHGQYVCFYDKDGNKPRQIEKSGNTIIKNELTDVCEFDIPKTASYIHVRMVGGGGAGGNANYAPVEGKIQTEQREHRPIDINLVSDDLSDSGSTVSANIYGESNPSNIIGVARDYIDNKFKDENGEPIEAFNPDTFRTFVRNNIIDQVFAYDYAGTGEAGGGVALQVFDFYMPYSCKLSNGSSTEDIEKCYNDFTQSKGPSTTCSRKKAVYYDGSDFPSDIRDYCPEFFIKKYTPSTPNATVSCAGSPAGEGTAFLSSNLKLFDYDSYPTIGLRWPAYNDGAYGANTYTPSSGGDQPYYCKVIDKIRQKGYENRIMDWLNCSFTIQQTVTPVYTYDNNLTDGTWKPYEGECKGTDCVVIGGKAYYTDADMVKGHPIFETNPEFSQLYPRAQKAGGGEIKIIPTEDLHDGEFPYFGKTSTQGVMLNKYAPSINPNPPSEIMSYNDARGSRGSSLEINDSFYSDIYGTYGEYSDVTSNCPNYSSYYGGSGGASSFNTANGNRLVCIANIGFLLKNKPNLRNSVLNASDSKFDCVNELQSKPEQSYPQETVTMSEDEFALRFDLRYYNKFISHGTPGRAGGYAEFMTRSYTGNKIKMKPGSGGTAKEIEKHELWEKNPLAENESARPDPERLKNQKPDGYIPDNPNKKHQDGAPTYLYYNCNAAGTDCQSRSVRGGKGGAGGVWEHPLTFILKSSDIKNIINNIKLPHKFSYCSSNAPAGNTGYGANLCSGNSFIETLAKFKRTYEAASENYIGQKSTLADVATLLNLPTKKEDGSNLSQNLESIGQGGNAGYAIDNCFLVPQFFVLRGGYHIGLERPIGDTTSDDGVIENEASLYLNLAQSDINQCRAAYKFPDSGRWYTEVRATDGQPGAVIITW